MQVPLNDLRRAHQRLAAQYSATFERVLARGSFVLGDEVAAFEAEFSQYCGVAHCVGVASGSDALELALRAVGVKPDDDVATVANAGMYGTIAIRAIRARPLYVDVADDTLTMSPRALDQALTPHTRAVIVTHLYGRLAAIEELADLTRRRGIALIEDCAQAHGARLRNGRAGSFGAIGCFSFYPTKNLGAFGDAGAIVTNDRDIAAHVRALRQYGWTRKYSVEIAGGRNSRLDELQAALLRVRLPFIDDDNDGRRRIVRAYAERIRHRSIRPPSPASDADVAHLAVIRSAQRESLRHHLASADVGTDVHYPIPDHRQPIVSNVRMPSLPVTERACAEVLSLPCFAAMTNDEVDYVIDTCNRWTP